MKTLSTLVILVSAFLCGCSDRDSEVDANGWPRQIVFAFVPDPEDPGRREAIYEKIGAYLAVEMGIAVKILKTSQYGPVIEAMRAEKVDMSNLSTFPYLIASKKVGVEPIASRSFADGSPRTSRSLFIARADSRWRDMDELLRDVASVRFAFVNPASTSGHLVPRAYLEKQGIDPEADFKELVYPGSQSASILAVLSGQLDAAAVSEGNLRKLLVVGKVREDELRILGQSPPIPSGCISIRSALPTSLKDAVRQAFLDLPTKAPALNAELIAMTSKYSAEPSGNYVLVDDSLFDGLRELSGSIESLAMLR